MTKPISWMKVLAIAVLFSVGMGIVISVVSLLASQLVASAEVTAVETAPVSEGAKVIVATPVATTVAIPYGEWISAILSWLRDILIAFVLGLLAKYGPAWAKTQQTDQVLTRAVDYAFGVTEGAVKGKELTVNIVNTMLEHAVNYAVANAPGIAAQVGSLLKPKILARIAAQSPTVGVNPINTGTAVK